METRDINLRVGETYQIELGGLATAGYTWDYIIDGPQATVDVSMEMRGAIPEAPPGGPPPGSYERKKLFTITALNPGMAQVRMILHRPWETDKPPLREVRLEVSVSE